jgi:hypothetical protein
MLIGFVSAGALNIDGKNVQYQNYTATSDTKNQRSLQSLSVYADTNNKHPGSDTYYPDFNKFHVYFSSTSYADDFVEAAFVGHPMTLANGNIDFTTYGYEGRAQAIKIASAYMGTPMEVISRLEAAVFACVQCNADACRANSTAMVDQAVALYTGSLEGVSGTAGDGTGVYTLAELRALDFNTVTDGKSKLNKDIFLEFDQMVTALSDGNCPSARSNKIQVAKLIFIPMIQSTIRSAWTLSTNTADEAEEVEAAAFAASILPLVADCSAADADIIYNEIRNSPLPDFAKIKSALEGSYSCIGISCADVGGYWDAGNQDYYPGASPCSSAVSYTLMVAIVTAGMAIFFAW